MSAWSSNKKYSCKILHPNYYKLVPCGTKDARLDFVRSCPDEVFARIEHNKMTISKTTQVEQTMIKEQMWKARC